MSHHSSSTIDRDNGSKEGQDQSVLLSRVDDQEKARGDACTSEDSTSNAASSNVQDHQVKPDESNSEDQNPAETISTVETKRGEEEEEEEQAVKEIDDNLETNDPSRSRSRSRSPSKSKKRSHSHHSHRHKTSSHRHRDSHSSRHDRHRHKSDKHKHHHRHHHHHRDKERELVHDEEKKLDDESTKLDVVPDDYLPQDETDLNGTKSERSHRNSSRSSRHRDDREKDRDKYGDRDRERDRHRHRSRRSRSRSSSRSKSSRHEQKRSGRRNSESPISKRNARTIFVMQLAARVTSRDLDEFFSSVGKVREVRLIMDTKTRRHKGIAYIEFQDASSVPLAFALNGQKICGVPLLIQPTQAEKNRQETIEQVQQTTNLSAPNLRPPGMRIYVGSLHPDLTEEMLKGVFEPFGLVSKIELIRSSETGKSKGYGFVTFYDPDDANKAIKQLNGFELAGKPIRVSKTTERSERSQSYANGQDKMNSTASIYSTNPIVNDFASPTIDRI